MNINTFIANVTYYSAVIVMACVAAAYSPEGSADCDRGLCSYLAPKAEFKQGELMPRESTEEQDIKEITAKVQMHK